MENIIDKNAEALANIVSANIDREVKSFLERYKLPFDLKGLREKGYHLIIEQKDTDISGKTEYTLVLCKIEEIKKFSIKTSFNHS